MVSGAGDADVAAEDHFELVIGGAAIEVAAPLVEAAGADRGALDDEPATDRAELVGGEGVWFERGSADGDGASVRWDHACRFDGVLEVRLDRGCGAVGPAPDEFAGDVGVVAVEPERGPIGLDDHDWAADDAGELLQGGRGMSEPLEGVDHQTGGE